MTAQCKKDLNWVLKSEHTGTDSLTCLYSLMMQECVQIKDISIQYSRKKMKINDAFLSLQMLKNYRNVAY